MTYNVTINFKESNESISWILYYPEDAPTPIEPIMGVETVVNNTPIIIAGGITLGSGKVIQVTPADPNASTAANRVLEGFFEHHNMSGGGVYEKKIPNPTLLEKILQMFRSGGFFGTIIIMPIIPTIPVLGGGETASNNPNTGIIPTITIDDTTSQMSIYTLEVPLSEIA